MYLWKKTTMPSGQKPEEAETCRWQPTPHCFNQLWAGFTGALLPPGYSTSCRGSPWQQLHLERKARAKAFEGPVPHQFQRPPAAPSHTPHGDGNVIRHLQTTDLPLHLHSIGFSGPWVFPFLLWAGTEKRLGLFWFYFILLFSAPGYCHYPLLPLLLLLLTAKTEFAGQDQRTSGIQN